MSGPAQRFPQLFDARRTRAIFALRALSQRIDDDYNRWLAAYGLTATKINYLSVLYSVEGHALVLSELGRFIHSSNANVTVMINALERDGLVQRIRDPEDRRSYAARLTPKGFQTIEKALPAHLSNLRTAMAAVSNNELDALTATLQKIASGFDDLMAGLSSERERPGARARRALTPRTG